jgi:hypothetical protein
MTAPGERAEILDTFAGTSGALYALVKTTVTLTAGQAAAAITLGTAPEPGPCPCGLPNCKSGHPGDGDQS